MRDLVLEILVGQQIRFVTQSGSWGDGELLYVGDTVIVVAVREGSRTWIDRDRLESIGVASPTGRVEDMAGIYDRLVGAGCRSTGERQMAEQKA